MKEGQDKIYYCWRQPGRAKSSRTWKPSTPRASSPAADRGHRQLLVGSLRDFEGKRLQSVAQGAADLARWRTKQKPSQGTGERRVRRPGGQAEGILAGQAGTSGNQPPDHLTGLPGGQRDRHRLNPAAG